VHQPEKAGAVPSAVPAKGPGDLESPASTELGDQNRLFGEAMRARERGERAEAVRMLEDFVRRYPASPLAQDAYVERFRAAAQLGDSAGAARAAREYLARYRDGFAREEARALALEATR
jgi:outer membrane protein assembly factor BamD (BamD/ComL family)